MGSWGESQRGQQGAASIPALTGWLKVYGIIQKEAHHVLRRFGSAEDISPDPESFIRMGLEQESRNPHSGHGRCLILYEDAPSPTAGQPRRWLCHPLLLTTGFTSQLPCFGLGFLFSDMTHQLSCRATAMIKRTDRKALPRDDTSPPV